jgi:hypothetical protein
VAESGNSAGFPFEAFPQLRALREMRREDFDGDGAIKACITRPIHFTHAARAQRTENLVRP